MIKRLNCRSSHSTALWFLLLSIAVTAVVAFTPSPLFSATTTTTPKESLIIRSVVQSKNPKGYVPKWTKKKTLAEEIGATDEIGFDKVGLKGTIPVVFKQGNDTRTSMAWAGQPIRDVATQAGQYIRYGCGKGECGTCECMIDGKWVRPCIETVPATAVGEEVVIMVKATMAKTVSSGKFYSIRSIILGFWNNLLGMFGFVRFRKAAKQNWEERRAYEDLVEQKTREKRAARLAASQQGGQA